MYTLHTLSSSTYSFFFRTLGFFQHLAFFSMLAVTADHADMYSNNMYSPANIIRHLASKHTLKKDKITKKICLFL